MMRGSKGEDLPDWPEYCFLPLAGYLELVAQFHGSYDIPVEMAGDHARLAALASWRPTQGIYCFDNDVYTSLSETHISGNLPTEVLKRLPQWGLYIETPGLTWFGSEMYGFFVHLEWDVNTQATELRFLLDCEAFLMPIAMLIGDWSITEAVDRVASKLKKEMQYETHSVELAVNKISQDLQPIISLILYLCSDEPEVEPIGQKYPIMPESKKTKKGFRFFPPDKPKIWKIGSETGKLLREVKSYQGGEHKRPKAHIRKAHWHGFWKGKRDSSQRSYFYKWLSPILVNTAEFTD